jgi:molybdate transport system ATP-binding protein
LASAGLILEARLRVQAPGFELDAELRAEAGGRIAILGPNGAGKTTALRALAGLVPLAGGFVRWDGVTLEDPVSKIRAAPERRKVGYVFQDARLFPHLSVLENVAFGARGAGRREARERAGTWLGRLGLAPLAQRRPEGLSGGETQRTALARALASEPQLLLLDEPLSALDARARVELRRDLGALLADFRGVCVMVTHEPIDALTLAKRLVVLEGGRVAQEGSAEEVARKPRSEYVANFVGVNLFRGIADGGTILLESGARLVAVGGDGAVLAVVPPRAVSIHLARPEGTPRNVWAGTVESVEDAGDRLRVWIRGDVSLASEVTRGAAGELGLRPGTRVFASVKAAEVAVYPA